MYVYVSVDKCVCVSVCEISRWVWVYATGGGDPPVSSAQLADGLLTVRTVKLLRRS